MRRNVGVLIVLLVLGVTLGFGKGAAAATLAWDPPLTYTDTTVITPEDQAQIIYTPYSGPSDAGPWVEENDTPPGVTSATVPEPPLGGTIWYTVTATLNGKTSTMAPPVSKTVPFPVPNCPENLTVE